MESAGIPSGIANGKWQIANRTLRSGIFNLRLRAQAKTGPLTALGIARASVA